MLTCLCWSTPPLPNIPVWVPPFSPNKTWTEKPSFTQKHPWLREFGFPFPRFSVPFPVKLTLKSTAHFLRKSDSPLFFDPQINLSFCKEIRSSLFFLWFSLGLSPDSMVLLFLAAAVLPFPAAAPRSLARFGCKPSLCSAAATAFSRAGSGFLPFRRALQARLQSSKPLQQYPFLDYHYPVCFLSAYFMPFSLMGFLRFEWVLH